MYIVETPGGLNFNYHYNAFKQKGSRHISTKECADITDWPRNYSGTMEQLKVHSHLSRRGHLDCARHDALDLEHM